LKRAGLGETFDAEFSVVVQRNAIVIEDGPALVPVVFESFAAFRDQGRWWFAAWC
jgi:hypothetical protein